MRGRAGASPAARWAGRLAGGAVVIIAVLCCFVAGARADWEIGFSVEEGVSILGGPLRYRLARPSSVADDAENPDDPPDGVTGASVDAITSASRVSHGGGIQVDFSRRGSGSIVVGLEYIHYRFDLDYQFWRARMDVVGLRLLALARLVLFQLRGADFLTFGFGGYLELSIYDRAEIAGSLIDIDVAPAAFGVAADVHLYPYAFELPNDRGTLVPGLYFRAYRGVLAQLRDEFGSSAPLASMAIGVELKYQLPGHSDSQGNGRPGR